MKLRNIALIAGVAVLAAACDEPLDVDPRASMPSEDALQTGEEVQAAVFGLYDALQADDGAYGRNAIVYPDLYAETLDFTGTYQTDREVDQHTVTASNVALEEIWGDFYDAVNRSNVVLDALPELGEEVSEDDRSQWEGEARFVRALAYFNLVRMFGDVPLVLEPTWDLEGDFQPAAAPMAEVYGQIETDLQDAVDLLAPEGSSDVATGYGAQTLLAKAYLEQGACDLALPLLDDVIATGPYELEEDYGAVFAAENNDELIFALDYTVTDGNSLAFWFYSPDFGGRWGFAPSNDLLDAYEGAERFEASVAFDSFDDPYGVKFHRISGGDDDVPVLRLADVYLMRAEANLCEGADAATVLSDINVVRDRAGLEDLDAAVVNTEEELRDALLHERHLELAMEGHRFYDLRRLGVAQERLGLEASQLYFPIPQQERDVNPNL